MKYKKIILALALPFLMMPQAYGIDKQKDKTKPKRSLLTDIKYTVLGLGCLGGAVYTGLQTRNVYKIYSKLPKYSFSTLNDILNGLLGTTVYAIALSDSTSRDIALRWQRWSDKGYLKINGSDFSKYLPAAELTFWGASTAIFGVLGLNFLAKGIHLKK